MLRKRIALLEGRHDLSFADFDAHWKTPHAKFISELPGLQEYVQNSVIDFWAAGEATRVDGVVEVWFDDEVVTSPEQHTSAAQQEDELVFIRTLTAVTVTDRRSYDSEEKVWLLAPEEFEVALDPRAFCFSPEEGAVLMERPLLLREPAAPRLFAVIPVSETDAVAVFERLVAQCESAPQGTRVLRTRSRRIR